MNLKHRYKFFVTFFILAAALSFLLELLLGFGSYPIAHESWFRLTSQPSVASILLIAEITGLTVFSFLLFFKSLGNIRTNARQRLTCLLSLSLFIFCAILFLNQISGITFTASGRPIAAVGLFMPGSWLSRSMILDLSPELRRIVDPGNIVLLALMINGAALFSAAGCQIKWKITLISFVGLLVCESFFSNPFYKAHSILFERYLIPQLLQFCLTQLMLLSMLSVLIQNVTTFSLRSQIVARDAIKVATYLVLTISVCFSISVLYPYLFKTSKRPLVGAHYYSWFPDNWSQGDIGSELLPPVLPLLGKYSNTDPQVFQQHLAWARNAGIDFFVFDWWPRKRHVRGRVYRQVKDVKQLADMRFALHYEALDLKSPFDGEPLDKNTNVVLMTPKRAWLLKEHWAYLAKYYMSNPQYLRINNKPVLFIYASRHLVGNVAQAIKEAWWHVKNTSGLELYLVGDEVYYDVLSLSADSKIIKLPRFEPDWKRLQMFDAITVYNPYDSHNKSHAGLQGVDSFVSDTMDLYQHYRAIASAMGQLFLPTALPAYNDRGVRLWADHHVIPRYVDKNLESSFFLKSLKQLALPFIDRGNPIFTITSWNEWNEGTAIEPAAFSPMTNQDSSGESALFSQLEFSSGYGCLYLDELSEILAENYP